MKDTPFLPLGRRHPTFAQGYRAALTDCTAWLHARARELVHDGKTRDARALRRAAHAMRNEAQEVAELWDEPGQARFPDVRAEDAGPVVPPATGQQEG